ncbi:HAD family phosphatase [Candidatus Woesearchaeota archaeon]|nr:HAD family phosphatase [Candidatus Woesearchaeota archaeon]
MYVIFDFDGVIVDSEKSIFKYFQKELKIYENIDISDMDFSKKVGYSSEDFLRQVTFLSEDKINYWAHKRREVFLNNVSYYEIIPGVVEQIKRLSLKYELAICSNSYIKFMIPVLKHYDVYQYFKYIFGMENTTKPKPDPEIYLIGKSKFEGSGFVIEDSVAGVLSAKKAGLTVVAITTSFLRSELNAADYIIDSFVELEGIIE